MATRQELATITERWIEDGWRKGDAGAVLEMYSDDFVDFSSPYAKRGTRDAMFAGSGISMRRSRTSTPRSMTW